MRYLIALALSIKVISGATCGGESVFCTQDVLFCADGTGVGRGEPCCDAGPCPGIYIYK